MRLPLLLSRDFLSRLLGLSVLAMAACGGGQVGSPEAVDAAVDVLPRSDVRASDARADRARETGVDSGHDASTDVTLRDAPSDVVPDVGHDAARESGRDSARDVEGDAPRDAASDHDARPAADARGDARDATTNEAADAAREAEGPPDAPQDTGVDATDAPPTETTLSFSVRGCPEAGGACRLGPLPLFPPFSTAISDYYVRCPAATNNLTVAMTAAPGSTIGLTQPVVTAQSVESTLPLTVASGAAIVAEVKKGSKTDDYWVRCLPDTFPAFTMTLHPDAGAPTPGYYIVGNTFGTSGASYSMVLDSNAVPVWYTSSPYANGVYDVENLLPGVISCRPTQDAPNGGAHFELHYLDGTPTALVSAVGAPIDIHELRLLSNGDRLVFANPIITGVDLTGLQSYGPNEDVADSVIQELDTTGAVVWSWSAYAHFDPVADSTFPNLQSTPTGGTAVNPYHLNSIEVASTGDLLVSGRGMDSIFLISKATGKVVWKMGGPTASIDGATYLTVTGDPQGQFHRQHDPRFQPDGSISLFDDQTGLPGPARAVIYTYDVAAGTATMVWQYEGKGQSEDMGSFRILPDGSRVVGWGYNPSQSAAFTELDANGNDLMDFAFSGNDPTYRAVKVTTSAFDINQLRATAGSP